MTYIEQLHTSEWNTKRLKILSRDQNCCKICNNEKLLADCDISYIGHYTKINSRSNNKSILAHCHLLNSEGGIAIHVDEIQVKQLRRYNILYSKPNKLNIQLLIGARKATKAEEDLFKKYDVDFNESVKKKFLKNDFNFEIGPFHEIENQKRDDFRTLNGFDHKDKDFKFVNGFHIHHKFYVKNLLAWEYPDETLITLCFDCHENLHKDQTIPVYENSNHLAGEYHFCKRCHGAGSFPEYGHVQSGICFRCSGNRFEELIH